MYVLEANKQITTTTKWNWKWSMQVTQDHFDFENVKDKAQAPVFVERQRSPAIH